MFIQTIRCGKDKRYASRLLCVARREGTRIRKYTILNVTNMSNARIEQLEAALQLKREHRGTELEKQDDALIVSIVVAGMTEGMEADNARRRANAADKDFHYAAQSVATGRKRPGASASRMTLNAAMRLTPDLEWQLQAALKSVKPIMPCEMVILSHSL